MTTEIQYIIQVTDPQHFMWGQVHKASRNNFRDKISSLEGEIQRLQTDMLEDQIRNQNQATIDVIKDRISHYSGKLGFCIREDQFPYELFDNQVTVLFDPTKIYSNTSNETRG